MQTLEVATEQLQWLKVGSLGRAPAQRKRRQRCSDFVRPCPTQKVLFVGAERWDEFKDAMQLVCQGHNVMAINPRKTAAARAFRRAGGRFIRARIEGLLPKSYRFDLIYENHPYPSGRHYVPARPTRANGRPPAGVTPMGAPARMPAGSEDEFAY